MDKRIPDLTQIQFSAITANDVLPIVNISTDETNKITIDQIKNYVNSGVTDTYVTGGTYFTGGTIIFDYNTGSNFEVSGLTEDLNNEIAGLAETDEQTITLNLDTNKIELKEIVAEATGGTRTFQGDFAISGGTLNLDTIGSGLPVINLGLDSSGEVVTGITGEFTYQIGQYVEEEGGVIFHRYKDVSNENYLVVSIDDISASSFWSNINNIAIGATARSTWDGLSNSNAITGQTSFTNGAAKLCLDSTGNTQTDWYLPAIDELSLLWQNRFNVNRTLSGASSVGTIPGTPTQIGYNTYWSSTENDSINAWIFYFKAGATAFINKNNGQVSGTNYVRAVRKFSI